MAFIGSWGFWLPATAVEGRYTVAGFAGYPLVYPGIDPLANLALLAFAPILAFPFIIVGVLSKRPVAKAGLVGIGLLGITVTWPILDRILVGFSYGAGPLIGLSAGSLLVIAGGLLGLFALEFGEWAKEYDDTPKRG